MIKIVYDVQSTDKNSMDFNVVRTVQKSFPSIGEARKFIRNVKANALIGSDRVTSKPCIIEE